MPFIVVFNKSIVIFFSLKDKVDITLNYIQVYRTKMNHSALNKHAEKHSFLFSYLVF